MDWAEIYNRFRRDRNDADAWTALEHRVRAWARSEFWDRGWHVVDDAVADTCSTVVVSLEKAHGAATFGGFVKGHFLNVRHKFLALHPTVSIHDNHENIPEPVPKGPDEEESALLRRCLERLSTREQRAVILRYFEEAVAARIATDLGVTEVNARRIVFNGLAHLRKCVQSARSLQSV